MSVKNLDNKIKIQKSKLRLYILIATLIPIILIAIFLFYLFHKNIEEIHTNDISQLKKTILVERKTFIRDVIVRTIYDIEQIRLSVANEFKLKSLSQKEIDEIAIKRITNHIRNLRPNKKNYIWINHVIDYNGGNNYAIRVVHPNLPDTEGTFLSTNSKDINGNTPYKTELEGIKKDGELYFDYYFKKLNSDKIGHKLSFAKLYKPFDWVIATGLYLDDLDEFISLKKRKMDEYSNNQRDISIIAVLVSIIFSMLFISYFQYRIKKLILSYESKIDNYTHKLEKMATTDQLTRLCNRLELDSIYRNELGKARRYNNEFSIIMIDLDYFKNVNDTYGHQVGDSVLKELSHILKSSVRSVDTVGRWGGEEFVIICGETNLNGALRLAEHIRVAVESFNFNIIKKQTCSFGVSSYHENDTQETMIERADNALYCAKENGRNTVQAEVYK